MSGFDIFISYSPEDNKPIGVLEKGWVSLFHSCLEQAISPLIKRKPTFLTVSNQEKPSSEQVRQVKILISILSPNYVNSTYCLEDIHIFSDSNLKKANIFKVVKYPVEADKEPINLRDLNGYNLFSVIEKSGEIQEIQNFFSKEAERYFWHRLLDLANEIANSLIEYDTLIPKKEGFGPKVYLGKVMSNIQEERNSIKRELIKKGCIVFPDENYPVNEKELEVYITKNIENSDFSIHLIGDESNNPFEKNVSLIQEIENNASFQHALLVSSGLPLGNETNQYFRFIWVNPEIRQNEEWQKAIIEKYLRNADSLLGSEILQTPLEEFKFLLKKKIAAYSIKTKTTQSIHALPTLYLIFDKIDFQEGNKIIDFFKGKGIKILQPIFEGALMEIRQNHIDNLRICDFAIIYSGKVNEKWILVKHLDLLKAVGFGRKKPMLAQAILIDPKSQLDYQMFKDYGTEVIEYNSEKSEGLSSFLSRFLNMVYE